jgi:hypothetical protein
VSLLFDNLLLALVSLLFDNLLLALVSLFDNLLLALVGILFVFSVVISVCHDFFCPF